LEEEMLHFREENHYSLLHHCFVTVSFFSSFLAGGLIQYVTTDNFV